MVGLESKNYYELLGVERGASVDQIKEAYRDIARVYHPDSNFYTEIIETTLTPQELQVFKLVTAAYNTLINKDRRQNYDDTLPPELRGWEDDDYRTPGKNPSDAFVILEKARMRAAASSTFGTVAPESKTERPLWGNDSQARSMADLLKEQRKASSSFKLVWGLGSAALALVFTLIYLLVR